MIIRIDGPTDSVTDTSDWQKMNNVLEIIAMSTPCGSRVMSGNVTKGAVIRCGGSWYIATEDTAITGTASPYVQLTPSIDLEELTAAYVATLTGVSFNKTYNTWSDVQGRVYLFDEAYAFAWGQIPAMNTIEAWRPANANLAKLLTAGLGNGKWRSLAETAYISEYFASGAPVIKNVTGTEDKPELTRMSLLASCESRITPSSDETEIFVITMSCPHSVVISGFDVLCENDKPSGANWYNIHKVGGGLVGTVTDGSSVVVVCDGNDEVLGASPVQYSVRYREYGDGELRGNWRCRVRCRVAPATIFEGEITPMESACGSAVSITIASSAG